MRDGRRSARPTPFCAEALPGVPRPRDDGEQLYPAGPNQAEPPKGARRLLAAAGSVQWRAVAAPAGSGVGSEPITLAIFGKVPPALAYRLPFSK